MQQIYNKETFPFKKHNAKKRTSCYNKKQEKGRFNMPLKLIKEQEKTMIAVPSAFMESFMPKAAPAYSVIYLYAYTCCCQGRDNLFNKELAQELDMVESDIVRAWKYWQEQGIVAYDEKSETVEFLDMAKTPPPKKKTPSPIKPVLLEQRPTYTPEEIAVYLAKSTKTKELFSSAQTHLNKMLTYQDMSTLFSFHDWLGLPMDVIEILLAYCGQRNHNTFSYIEKVAIDWAENGINTPQKALERITLYTSKFPKILKAFGEKDINRNPVPTERTFIKKWFTEYEMPLELVEYACEKTILNTGKISFSYADKIITSWHQKKVKTLDAVKQLDAEFIAGKKEKKTKAAASSFSNNTSQKKNRFINYDQRDWDFETLEKMEKEYMKKKLEE